MLKKAITYTDYNGNSRTEDFYFNISKSELAIMEMSVDGGLRQKLELIVQKQNIPAMIETFRSLIHKSYGEKSPDGRQFLKRDPNGHDLADAFEQTEAFDILFMELCYNSEAASAFVNGILPKDLDKAIEQAQGNAPKELKN